MGRNRESHNGRLVAGAIAASCLGIGGMMAHKADWVDFQSPLGISAKGDLQFKSPVILHPSNIEYDLQGPPLVRASMPDTELMLRRIQMQQKPYCPDMKRAGEVVVVGEAPNQLTVCLDPQSARVRGTVANPWIEIHPIIPPRDINTTYDVGAAYTGASAEICDSSVVALTRLARHMIGTLQDGDPKQKLYLTRITFGESGGGTCDQQPPLEAPRPNEGPR